MTDNNSSESSQDWQQVQQQYWDTWFSLNHQILNTPAHLLKNVSMTSLWAEALELWWQALSPSISPNLHDIFRKFIEQGQSYFRLNGEFIKVFQKLSDVEPHSTNWSQIWDKGFAELQKNFSDLIKNEESMLGFWELPLHHWLRTETKLSSFPGDFLSHLKESYQSQLNPELDQFLSNHIFQKWQDQILESQQLWQTYQKALTEYSALFGKIGLLTINLLHDKVMQLSQKGESLKNLRAVYDLWVDCGEEAYAQLVYTKEYADIHAQLINALMAWKQYERQRIDDLLALFHMPTRQDFDTLNARMQKMRRDFRRLQMEQNEVLIDELHQEIQSLRTEIEQLKKNTQTSAQTTQRAPRKKTSRQKVSKNPNSQSPKSNGE